MKILFMSEEHAIKRKMASYIAAHFAPEGVKIHTAKVAFEPTDHVLKESLVDAGVTCNDAKIYPAGSLMLENYDLVITLCESMEKAAINSRDFPTILNWTVLNPVRKGIPPHRIKESINSMRDILIGRVRHLFADGYLRAFVRQHRVISDMFEDNSQGVIRFNREEIIIAVNQAAVEITGFSADRLCGKPMHYLIPDDMVSRHALAVTDQGVSFLRAELKMKRSDQEVMKVRATFKAQQKESGQGGYLAFEESHDNAVIQPMEGSRGLERLSWDRVEASLKQTGGNRTKAARMLGVGRATFYRFLDREKMMGRIPGVDAG